jgi:hypothetical protein
MPSAQRHLAKEELAELWLRPGLARLRSRAHDLYDEFSAADELAAAPDLDASRAGRAMEGLA